MKIFALSVAAVALGAAMTFSGAASATEVTCSGIYYGAGTLGEANGTETLPATDVGTVTAGCQIGNLATNNVSGTGVFVSSNANPSVFQFEWGGGYLNISEALGNNGTFPNGIDVELGALTGNSVNTTNGSLASELASINFSSPFHFGLFETLYSGNLSAGTYLIDTYSGTLTDDPTYQIDFATTVPEPMSFALLGAGLLGLGLLRRRQLKKAAAI